MSDEKKKSIRDAYIAFKQDPENNQAKLLKCLTDYRDTWHAERKQTQDTKWKNNVAFYAGDHRVREMQSTSNYRAKLKENHVNNVMNRTLSIFAQNMPITRVFSNSIDQKDVSDAESTEFYGKYLWRTKKLEKVFTKYVKYSCIFGSSFAYRKFDPDLGGRILLDANETRSGDEEIKYYKGDVKLEIDDPFRWLFRPGIDDMDEMYDAIRSIPASRFALEEAHGPLEADAAVGLNAYSGSTRKDDEMVMQHHYYHKPTAWFEEGLYACWAGTKLIEARDATESEKILPVTHLPFDAPPMKFYGVASIEQVMDLQEQLNRAAEMIVEARNLVARPRVFSSNEAKVPIASLSDRPGEHIKFALAGQKPTFEVPSFQFAEMQAHKSDLRGALTAVMGLGEASRGNIPASIKTALALQLVLEQDRSQFTPFIKSFHQGILDNMQGLFSLAAENIPEDDPRMVKIAEQTHAISKPFHGGMVPDPIDCYLEDTNPIGWTKAGEAENAMNIIQLGLVKDPNRALEMLKMNNPDPAYRLIQVNKQAAAKENDLLNKGTLVPVGSEDIDPLHLDEHLPVVMSFSFRSLPKAVQDAYLSHVAEHKQRLAPPPGAAGPGGPPMSPGGPPPGAGGPPPVMPIHKPSASPHPMQSGLAPPGGDSMDTLLAKVRG